MDDEVYQIEVTFEVAMTKQNYERGNIYLQSDFTSYKKKSGGNLILARTGFLAPEGSIRSFMK